MECDMGYRGFRNEDDYWDAKAEYAAEMAEQKRRTYKYNCGGFASYHGPCGASDCGSCRNGPPPWEEEDDAEPCLCGKCNWDGSPWDDARCSDCDTGPLTMGRRISKTHTARKSYGSGQYEIRPGDLYRRTVQFAHWPNGPSTLEVSRTRLEKGPAWAEDLSS